MPFGLEQRITWLRPDAYTAAAIVTGYAVASLLIGYVIALGQPVPIALAFGLVAGVALLSATNLLYHFPPLMAVIGRYPVNCSACKLTPKILKPNR